MVDDPISDSSDGNRKPRYQARQSGRETEWTGGVQRNPLATGARGSIGRTTMTRAAKNKVVNKEFDDKAEFDYSTPLAQLGSHVFRNEKEVPAVRIAVGKKVFSKLCKVRYVRNSKQGRIILSYDGPDGKRKHEVNLDDESVQEMKYFLADDDEEFSGKTISIDFDESEQMSFLAMKIQPSDANGLAVYPNAYVPSPSKKGSDSALNKKYIAVEFRSDAELQDLLHAMKQDITLSAFVTQSSKLVASDAEVYGSSLLGAARKERMARESSIGSPRARRTRNKLRGSKVSNEVMVVFPFGADEEEIDEAADGLQEAGFQSTSVSTTGPERIEGAACGLKTSDDDEGIVTASSDDVYDAEDYKDAPPGKMKSRAHFLTIRDEDFDRLQPGEFLNDTLIDFWFQWCE